MIVEKKLEERLVALEAAKSWSPRVVSRLEMLLRSGTEEELYRINPIQFAVDKSVAEAEAIKSCAASRASISEISRLWCENKPVRNG
jgi:hypothetical protein